MCFYLFDNYVKLLTMNEAPVSLCSNQNSTYKATATLGLNQAI